MDLTNYLRKDTATPTIYYGYSSDLNAASTDFNWSIRKVTSGATVETVTWSNGDPAKPYAKWNDRVNSFITPAGSLGLTCSFSSPVLNISWNQLSGANRYQVVVSESSKIYSDGGGQIYYNNNATQITKEVINGGSYKYNYASSGLTYTVTLTAVNVAGSSASTVTITT